METNDLFCALRILIDRCGIDQVVDALSLLEQVEPDEETSSEPVKPTLH